MGDSITPFSKIWPYHCSNGAPEAPTLDFVVVVVVVVVSAVVVVVVVVSLLSHLPPVVYVLMLSFRLLDCYTLVT